MASLFTVGEFQKKRNKENRTPSNYFELWFNACMSLILLWFPGIISYLFMFQQFTEDFLQN